MKSLTMKYNFDSSMLEEPRVGAWPPVQWAGYRRPTRNSPASGALPGQQGWCSQAQWCFQVTEIHIQSVRAGGSGWYL